MVRLREFVTSTCGRWFCYQFILPLTTGASFGPEGGILTTIVIALGLLIVWDIKTDERKHGTREQEIGTT